MKTEVSAFEAGEMSDLKCHYFDREEMREIRFLCGAYQILDMTSFYCRFQS